MAGFLQNPTPGNYKIRTFAVAAPTLQVLIAPLGLGDTEKQIYLPDPPLLLAARPIPTASSPLYSTSLRS